MHIGQVRKLAFVSMMGMVSGQWEDMVWLWLGGEERLHVFDFDAEFTWMRSS